MSCMEDKSGVELHAYERYRKPLDLRLLFTYLVDYNDVG